MGAPMALYTRLPSAGPGDEQDEPSNSINGPSSRSRSTACEDKPVRGLEDKQPVTHPHELDIVQFAAPIYIVEENEHAVTIDIMRLGSMSGRVKVRYYTEDGSAKAGVRYASCAGEVTFEEDEHTKQIQVMIIEDDLWAATLEFKVHLADPWHCELGQYLQYCRVKVVDQDLFPSSKYRGMLEQGEEGIQAINGWGLFWEYCKMNYRSEGMAWRTLVTLTLDQMKNMYIWLQLWVGIYMCDVIFNTTDPGTAYELVIPSREGTAGIIGAIYILPMVALHIWDMWKVKIDVAGRSRLLVQSNLFRKYLNYSEHSRLEVQPAKMQFAIMHEASVLAGGYEALLNMIESGGKHLVLTLFLAHENRNALWFAFAMPGLMAAFCLYRNKLLSETSHKVDEKYASLSGLVQETCVKYRLVADYAQRPQMNELFMHKADSLLGKETPAELVKMNTKNFSMWLGPLFIGAYISFAAPHVLAESLTLGRFLSTITVLGYISSLMKEMYDEFLMINHCIFPLRNLSYFFNLATDLGSLQKIQHHRREVTTLMRDAVMKQTHSKGSFRSDQIPIDIDCMSFRYKPDLELVLQNVSASVPQGKLVAIVGPHESGKATLLRLLGSSIFPTEGSIFIPTHLRILHVDQTPFLLDDSAWHNLAFGCSECSSKAPPDRDRILKIMTKLGMVETLKLVDNHSDKQTASAAVASARLSPSATTRSYSKVPQDEASELSVRAESEQEEAEEEEEDGGSSSDEDEIGLRERRHGITWHDPLPHSEKMKIQIARALITNPEVLVLQRPFQTYDPGVSRDVMNVIKEFVENRGLCLNHDFSHRRRPRTCFFTTEKVSEAKEADIVWRLDPRKKSIQQLDPQSAWFSI